jgi:5'(3')-deoxyribonucleotidase
MKIGLDIDSVLLNTIKSYLEIYNAKYKKDAKFKDIIEFNFGPLLGLDKPKMYEIFEEIDFSKTELMDSYIPEVIDYFKGMGYQIDLITASSPKNIEAKCERLIYFGINFDKVINIDVHSGNKGIYAKDYSFIVDDSAEQLESIAKNGGNAICYTQPWNKKWQGKRINNFLQLKNEGAV